MALPQFPLYDSSGDEEASLFEHYEAISISKENLKFVFPQKPDRSFIELKREADLGDAEAQFSIEDVMTKGKKSNNLLSMPFIITA